MTKYKKIKNLFVFIPFLLLINCAIKERMEATAVPTYVEKPPELIWQDATRYLRNKNYTEAILLGMGIAMIFVSSLCFKVILTIANADLF